MNFYFDTPYPKPYDFRPYYFDSSDMKLSIGGAQYTPKRSQTIRNKQRKNKKGNKR